VHPLPELESICRRFFAAAETDEILCQPPEARLSAFFACWTRKEAFVKATGKGLQIRFDLFRVNVRPDDPPRLISLDWHESATWSLADLSEPGIAGALAVNGPPTEIRRFEFAVEVP
jgi:4'-phosphopantetheinyl transferase